MSAESIVSLITGAGGVTFALVVFLGLIISGQVFTKSYVQELKQRYEAQILDKDAQIAEKNEALRIERDRGDAERRRGDVAVEAAQTANVLIASVTGRREIGAS